MHTEENTFENYKKPKFEEPGRDHAADQNILERSTDAYAIAEKAVGDTYGKTAHAVGETYEQARRYGKNNPDRAILIALGIGIGLGYLLGAGTRPSRTSRFAQPVVHALSNIALSYLR